VEIVEVIVFQSASADYFSCYCGVHSFSKYTVNLPSHIAFDVTLPSLMSLVSVAITAPVDRSARNAIASAVLCPACKSRSIVVSSVIATSFRIPQ
jgi:hypothetical protein